jgi:hypothetical protein
MILESSIDRFLKREMVKYALQEGRSFREISRILKVNEEDVCSLKEELDIY